MTLPEGPTQATKNETTVSIDETIAVVGGGIAGIFTCLALLRLFPNVKVYLLESTGRLGGRIRTVRIQSIASGSRSINERVLPVDNSIDSCSSVENGVLAEACSFHVEFGPMRVELELQRLVHMLMRSCGIGSSKNTNPLDRLEDFPPFSSPKSLRDPSYNLPPAEEGREPLELLELAILRVLMHLHINDKLEQLESYDPNDDWKDEYKSAHSELRNWLGELKDEVKALGSVGLDPIPYFRRKVQKIGASPESLWLLQKYGQVRDPGARTPEQPIPLYRVGFWNLLSGFLSHDGMQKLQALGTFYHLFPENPNAAEWLTWWLEALAITDSLKGVAGGMERIIEHLRKMLSSYTKEESEEPRLVIQGNFKVRSLREDSGGITIVGRVRPGGKEIHFRGPGSAEELTANEDVRGPIPPEAIRVSRIFLALPKRPAAEILRLSQSRDDLFEERTFRELGYALKSAVGFPMIKIFALVRHRWWKEEVRANLGATRMPTRELYAWSPSGTRAEDRMSKEGLVMLYTDRPATSFWTNYVPGDRSHEDFESWPALDRTGERPWAGEHLGPFAQLDDQLAGRLKRKLCRYINASEGVGLKEDDILWVGIRDWGRGPFGAANHAWRPKRRFWIAMNTLSGIPTKYNPSRSKIHVCGEAYSDYHGFIEGALRSSVLAVFSAFEKVFEGKHCSQAAPCDEGAGALLSKMILGADAQEGAESTVLPSQDKKFLKYLHWWLRDVKRWPMIGKDEDGQDENYLFTAHSIAEPPSV